MESFSFEEGVGVGTIKVRGKGHQAILGTMHNSSVLHKLP